jgi:hypothetical protein
MTILLRYHKSYKAIMIKPLFLLSVLLSATLTSMGQSNDTSSITKTHWLVGTWKGQHNGAPFYETWRKRGDNSLICYSISIKGADTMVKKNSEILLLKNIVTFLDPNAYEAKRLMDNEMVFEINHQHGFSRLIWFHTPDDHWLALLQFPKVTGYYDLVRVPELDRVVDRHIAAIK